VLNRIYVYVSVRGNWRTVFTDKEKSSRLKSIDFEDLLIF